MNHFTIKKTALVLVGLGCLAAAPVNAATAKIPAACESVAENGHAVLRMGVELQDNAISKNSQKRFVMQCRDQDGKPQNLIVKFSIMRPDRGPYRGSTGVSHSTSSADASDETGVSYSEGSSADASDETGVSYSEGSSAEDSTAIEDPAESTESSSDSE